MGGNKHYAIQYTWASPLELEGDWAEAESEFPLVCGGLDWWESCRTHEGQSSELVPPFTGTGDLSISSVPSSESTYMSFKSKLFILTCPAVHSWTSEHVAWLFGLLGFKDDAVCTFASLASCTRATCCGIPNTDTVRCCFKDLKGPGHLRVKLRLPLNFQMMCSNLEVPAMSQICFFLHVQRYGLQGSLKDEITDPDQLSGLIYWLQSKEKRNNSIVSNICHTNKMVSHPCLPSSK